MNELLERTRSAADFLKGNFQGCSRALGSLIKAFEVDEDQEEYQEEVALLSPSDLENGMEHLMANLMKAAIKRCGVRLAEFPADYFGDTRIHFDNAQQTEPEGPPEPVAQGDDAAFLKLMQLAAPTKRSCLGDQDQGAQAYRLDSERTVAMAEFPECSWRHQGISLIDWYMFCDHLLSLFDRDWRYGFEPYKAPRTQEAFWGLCTRLC